MSLIRTPTDLVFELDRLSAIKFVKMPAVSCRVYVVVDGQKMIAEESTEESSARKYFDNLLEIWRGKNGSPGAREARRADATVDARAENRIADKPEPRGRYMGRGDNGRF